MVEVMQREAAGAQPAEAVAGSAEEEALGHSAYPVPRRCTYDLCESPTDSRHFHRIDKYTKAGGQDWSVLVGRVLCETCYSRYRRNGSLVRSDSHRPLAASDRKCSYAGCDHPTESRDFYRINKKTMAGGQDWSKIVGWVLCDACYAQFKRRGTLVRCDAKAPIVGNERRCTNPKCDKPTESSYFHRIGDGSTKAGGRDWKCLAGNVLCHLCYMRFKDRGTLERSEKHKRRAPQAPAADAGEAPPAVKMPRLEGPTMLMPGFLPGFFGGMGG
mmetsp:Transcript_50534/g.121106  ORF Transcript_50534/g.121106 Transcript_50534/m.121106 type:complete len:272 (-) Transcript_50534:9-824(-)